MMVSAVHVPALTTKQQPLWLLVRATTSIPGVDGIFARIASLRAQGSFVS